ncbi:MAG: ABC transporter ATP-binding protein [Epsilonproteobacteria bacterium]|jgi:branched-chain amino acid transport system ATP-binding protein|uniref:ABC transporter ATP-binding protein n=1 Tax=Sulfurospirillum TaxID=57665 RepID=UPI00054251B5|nr:MULTISPECIES: ABC transporter ATP-binding protein [Sulfurospirillum]MDY0265494.1 ABC transporter ATP-binding protein [Sulfurospirillum cavolei]NCB53326.1 ABC transporter ATP-binding protein [Campylobacterota bacterium]KHG34912.1 MAG: amino acid ABC transporter ATPase [Sulfurospirillum sp. MES]MCP3652157.1 ABC transporter ATP-binding protein [Sulfurospirillum sp. DNRA8]MCR1811007.1 ABC transporter ATP-binding protein [Sulfurospirillum sp. DNRA8]
MRDMLLEVKDLHVNYGAIAAIKGIDLHVARGEVVTILGANGAGKTTTLRTISGLLKAASGSIVFDGRELSKLQAHEIVALGMSHSPEGRRVFSTLSVEENLMMGAYTLKKYDQATLDWIYEILPRLKERRKQLAGTLSGGEQQMLAIGRAIMSKPKLLILDEPSLGLAPVLVKVIFKAIKAIAKSGVTVLLVEQNAKAALKLADRGYVLELGKITHTGSSEELLNSEVIQEAYLGKKK